MGQTRLWRVCRLYGRIISAHTRKVFSFFGRIISAPTACDLFCVCRPVISAPTVYDLLCFVFSNPILFCQSCISVDCSLYILLFPHNPFHHELYVHNMISATQETQFLLKPNVSSALSLSL